jgi:hypothetical protein
MLFEASKRKSDDTATNGTPPVSLHDRAGGEHSPCSLRTEPRVIGQYGRRIGLDESLGRA